MARNGVDRDRNVFSSIHPVSYQIAGRLHGDQLRLLTCRHRQHAVNVCAMRDEVESSPAFCDPSRFSWVGEAGPGEAIVVDVSVIIDSSEDSRLQNVLG
jgi:hypothetical protein